ncbi:SDR family NAD(P)-dependent oxidoreductase [Clostridium oryzae]|uniref:UDP-N-acetylglucosamine 4,6-dehydratase (Inverting) n=1 Tax=Clostridium oryzae TaxID=1450648 RepID=A0A1V4ILT4_9CLOT|nr:SDR family NAD(P)-dependent oxidoreductase [Clostridium oryzae]OPJ60886.1 UDP-N-acetylglucosamine 4,6-dehydratase (inverting) [Clostridium oryzae]
MTYYTGKNILIIGGTGTIGTGIVEELLKNHNPKVIRIFSRDEYKQFVMQNEYRDKGINKLRFLIGDVRDYYRLERAMADVDVVFNLAAMKHVPSCEYNPDEAIKTNVNGMENVVKAAMYNDVSTVIFTSSDKAINPTNSYGATKMLAEKLVQAANYSKGPRDMKFVAVRFGNVMGSRGSVIPLFKRQVVENRRITVTDGAMDRFMMTRDQAVKLTLKAGEIGIGGELFVLKMPVLKLGDLAEVVVEETGKKYDIDSAKVKIEHIGIRAGEKMYEELMTYEESKYAYDLGEMYAVIPVSFNAPYYERKYQHYTHCEPGSYSSHNQNSLTKEQVRQLILNANLI